MKLHSSILVAFTLTTFCFATNCYFPNGNVAPDSVPCRPVNKANFEVCCPTNWECYDNGLCYLEAENFYGRYSCTSRDWSDNGCPDYCTQSEISPSSILATRGKDMQEADRVV